MSVEAPKTVEATPVVNTEKALPEQPETSTAPAETPAAVPAETAETAPAATTEEPATGATEEVKKDETVVEAVPASEGVLGYKEPGFFKKFIFTKHYFWFSEEAASPESLTVFLRSEKADAKHSSAAWARETGKGLLFYTKRVEDKATPAGVINLSDASPIVKESFNQFSFKAGSHQHRFETTTSKERDSWVVALEKAIEEAKALKEDVVGRESYKKNIEEYSKPAITPVAAVKTPRSKSKEPKKSLDATTATAAASTPATETAAPEAEETPKSKTERSQSRKRASIFGSLLNKKEEHADKKEDKSEAKKEVKEETVTDEEPKKEEAKETQDATPAVEAAEASTAAAVPITAVSTDKEEKKEDGSPVEKKNKRGSVFGSFFKKGLTSPSTEKSEKEATASDVPPVSETAPKIDEPIENKPIDAAAVTAPVDTVETPSVTEQPAKDAAPTTTETPAPKSEKKGGLIGFIKKGDAKKEGKKEAPKEEVKDDKPAESTPAEATEVPTSAAAVEATPAATEERPTRDNKRRTSLFFNKKDKDVKETTEAEDTVAEPKREKSPLPGGKFIGSLVRRASKAIKSEGPKDKPATTSEPATTETTTEPAAAATETTTSEPAPAPVSETTETKAAETAPEPVVAPEPVAATTAAPEVKATA